MIRRLTASRFRSLGKDVTVDLGALTVLVGRNGAGKSNAIDALVFLADCMQIGLEGAVTKRGGMQVIRHAGSRGHPYDVSVQVELEADGADGTYGFTLGGDRIEDYKLKREFADLRRGSDRFRFRVEDGKWVDGPPDLKPRVEATSLALPLLAGDERFAPLATELRSVASYSIFPDELRTPHKYDPRRPMDRHGSNWVSVLKDQPEETWKSELVTVLERLTGDIVDIEFKSVAGFLVLQFRHRSDPRAKQKVWFDAGQESDGTLRVAGMITALLQRPRPRLIAVEEPELTVHPGALRLLYDYIKESSLRGQIVLTTHSPELLSLLDADDVRVVVREEEETRVAGLDESQRDVVRNGLFTLGEVMRSEELRPVQLPIGATAT